MPNKKGRSGNKKTEAQKTRDDRNVILYGSHRCFHGTNSDDRKAAPTVETDAARELGIFGSPTFTVGRELFWGDHRLADAISWCRFGHVQHG